MDDQQTKQDLLERFRALLRSITAVMFELDQDGRIVFCSESSETLLGRHSETLIGSLLSDLVQPDDKERLAQLLQPESTKAAESEPRFAMRHPSGELRYFDLQTATTTDPSGRTEQVVVAADVTEMQRTLDRLSASENRYRALTENTADLIVEIDSSGHFLYVSPNSQDLLGHAPEDLVGQSIESIVLTAHVDPGDRGELLDGFRRSVTERGKGGQYVYRLRHADGRLRWFESRARTHRDQQGEVHAVVISRDITDIIDAQNDLAELEKRYALLGETSRDLMLESGPDHRFVFVSRSVRGLLGFEPEELIGTHSMDLIHPEDTERVRRDFWTSEENPQVSFTPPYRVRLKDGSYRWFEGSAISYTRRDGSGPWIVGLLRDVNERIAISDRQRALEERIQSTQRLEGLGVMAGGIAHDFNNLLTPILGQASLALMDLPEDSPARERIEKVRNAARHAAKLTNQMLAYAGAGPLEFQPTELSELVRDMGQLAETAVSGSSPIRFELSADLPLVDADSGQLSQVVMNLISNAAEALADEPGAIAVRTHTMLGSAACRSNVILGELDDEIRYVCFEVEDEGVGMDEATRKRIFDPFFTTKFTGRGLGLAAVLGIVQGHGGAIELETAVGCGTRFRVWLPVRDGGEASPRDVEAACDWRASGLVLVANHDDGVRDVAADTLRRCGLAVLTAHDGQGALELFRRHSDELTAVLIDRTMPLVSGAAVLAEMRRYKPYLPVIIVTGSAEQDLEPAVAAGRPEALLKKPFLPNALVETLRKVLGD